MCMMDINSLCTPRCNELPEVLRIRELVLREFSDLQFDPGPHEYRLRGNILPSVSSVVHKFKREENFQEIAKNYARKNGYTAQYWLDKWKFNNLRATITGTLVHEYGESLGWLLSGHPELIGDRNLPKYIESKGWLIPTRPKEEAVLKFWEDLHPSLKFILAEARVYSGKGPESTVNNQFAGTFDLLMYYTDPSGNKENDGVVIFDYKTNKSLTDDFSREHGRTLLPPFTKYLDESLSIYTLQQSLYALCLRGIGLPVKGLRLVWLKEDGTYEIVKVDDLSQESWFRDVF